MLHQLSNHVLSEYKSKGFTEIEELFSDQETAELFQAIQDAETPIMASSFLAGRNLFESSKRLQNIIFGPKNSHIASTLSHQKALQIGYDQLFFGSTDLKYLEMLPEFASLNEMSSMNGIAIGMLLSVDVLEPPEITTEEPEAPIGRSKTREEVLEEEAEIEPISFPKEPKNALFFDPRVEIPWRAWFEDIKGTALLAVWVKPGARYVQTKLDPLNNALKNEGYAFGDVLLAETHPLVKK